MPKLCMPKLIKLAHPSSLPTCIDDGVADYLYILIQYVLMKYMAIQLSKRQGTERPQETHLAQDQADLLATSAAVVGTTLKSVHQNV